MSKRNSLQAKAQRRADRAFHAQQQPSAERILHSAVRCVHDDLGRPKASIRSFWTGNHKHNSRHRP